MASLSIRVSRIVFEVVAMLACDEHSLQFSRRVSVCISLTPREQTQDAVSGLEAAVRRVQWLERALRWHEGKSSQGIGCGFESGDMYEEFSDSAQEFDAWTNVAEEFAPERVAAPTLEICCSLESPIDEERKSCADGVLAMLRSRFAAHVTEPFDCVSMRVLLVSRALHLPLADLSNGIVSFHVASDAMSEDGGCQEATQRLADMGMFVVPDVLNGEDVDALLQLASASIQAAESRLLEEGEEIGSGNVHYAEICSRGVQRWDLLLHLDGERIGSEENLAVPGFNVLEHIATHGPWLEPIVSTLGSLKWQASIICSRPGAPAGKWHSDGGHSRFSFGGESASAYAICVFVPLVPIEAPTADASQLSGVRHGRGCTAFWPGSHRIPECPHLGAAAASRLRAVLPGAPLNAGAALVYDYRIVHCASPNDAHDLADGSRPILQLTYCLPKYNDASANYGYYQLFS